MSGFRIPARTRPGAYSISSLTHGTVSRGFIRSLVVYRLGTMISGTAAIAQPSGSPLIVFVHRRNQMGKTHDALRNEWFDAFNTGLQRIGASDLLQPRDYLKVFHQDIYRDNGPGHSALLIKRKRRAD